MPVSAPGPTPRRRGSIAGADQENDGLLDKELRQAVARRSDDPAADIESRLQQLRAASRQHEPLVDHELERARELLYRKPR